MLKNATGAEKISFNIFFGREPASSVTLLIALFARLSRFSESLSRIIQPQGLAIPLQIWYNKNIFTRGGAI